MFLRSSRAALCGLVLVTCAAAAVQAQTPVFSTARTIAGGDAATQVAPVERTLAISGSGTYNVTLTDVQSPAAFQTLTLAVTKGATVVATAAVSASGPGVATFTAASAGTYIVHVVGAPASGQASGTAKVDASKSDGTPVAGFTASDGTTMVSTFTAALGKPVTALPSNAYVIDTNIAVTTSGDTAEIDLADLGFPASLGNLIVSITDPSGNVVIPALSAAGTQASASFTTTPGTYHLIGSAQAASGAAGGLFYLHVFSKSSGTDLLVQTQPVGPVSSLGSATLSVGAYNLTFADFSFPAALTQAAAAAVNGSTIVKTPSGTPPLNASVNVTTAGTWQIFAIGTPTATPGLGSYGIKLTSTADSSLLFSAVQTATTGSPSVAAFTYPVSIAKAGAYSLRLTDFQFPQAFATLQAAAAQGGALLSGGMLTSSGSANVTLTTGQMYLLVVAVPGSGSRGLFGADLTPGTGGTAAFSVTQGVGAAFGATAVSLSTAGSYDLTLSDLSFPVAFSDLSAVVTQGAVRVGSIFGTGTITFAASGNYVVNVLGTPAAIASSSSQKAGTYGLAVATTPPAPTVSLTASASQVASGGTVTLNWSSQNATSCTASGAWSGTLATSGQQTSPAITSSATFTLTCTGTGGNTAQSVTVTLIPTSTGSGGGGGGGSLDGTVLLLLGVVITGRWVVRNRSTRGSSERRARIAAS